MRTVLTVVALLFLAGCTAKADSPANVSQNWLTYGGTADEQRFSPLTSINAETVQGLVSRGVTSLTVRVAWRRHRSLPMA